MPTEIINYSTILIELNKAVKMHNLYPQGHPNLDMALDKCFAQIRKAIDEGGEIEWKMDQKGFYSGKTPIMPGNHDLAALAKKLFFRRIKEVTFTKRVSIADMKIFLSVLKVEPEALQATGGVEAFFAQRDLSGILLNELRYEDLRRIKKELEEKREAEEKNEQALEIAEEPAKGESSAEQEERRLDGGPQHIAEDAELATLLYRIRKETDLLRYNSLAVHIKEHADGLLIEKKYDETFPALLVFLEHSSERSGLSPEIKSTAGETLRSLLSPEMIDYLIERAGAVEEEFRLAIQGILVHAGDAGAEKLLDSIIDAQDTTSRRHYFKAIVLFGPAIRPRVEERLRTRAEWFAARQMIAILGELGDPASVEALASAYAHEDVRVKKEVLKSLVKIHSKLSIDFLVKALEEEDESLVNQAIISLGMLKDSSVVDVLGRLAVDAGGQETRKEAIKALGIISHKSAVPYLTSILHRTVWFGKKSNEETRLLAAASLAAIGGEDAYKAIKDISESSSGELYSACRRFLEGRERVNERSR